jgi:hypothetical protein
MQMCLIAQDVPILLHHITYLQGHAVLIDLQVACPNLSKQEHNSFLLHDRGINPANVTDVFMVPSTQLLCVIFQADGPCLAALASLQAGIPWAAAEGALVYGGRQRPPCLGSVFLAAHPTLTQTVWRPTGQFGRVVQSSRGVDCSFGNVFDGVIHFTIQLHSDITLPHFINIKDEGGHLAEYLFIFSDQHRRCCFCFHVGQFRRAAIKASGVSEAL